MTDSIERYTGILEEQQRLQAMLPTVTDTVRPLIEQGLTKVATKISDLETDPTIASELTRIGRTSLQALEELDSLQSAVELGIFSQEEIDTRRQEITGNTLNKLAIKFVGKTGLAQSTKVELVADTAGTSTKSQQAEHTSSAERTIHYPDVKITVNNDGVQIGNRGKFVKLSSESEGTDEPSNYRRERLAVLKTLIESENDQDNPILVKDLWERALPGEEFNGTVFTQVKIWLDKLTYSRVPLVGHNGVRGSSSAYWMANPNVRLVELSTTVRTGNVIAEQVVSDSISLTDSRPVVPAAETPALTEDQIDQKDTDIVTVGEVIDAEHTLEAGDSRTDTDVIDDASIMQESGVPVLKGTPARPEAKKVEVFFPLNHAQASILAELLAVKRSILTDIGLPPFDVSIADNLRAGLSQAKLFEQMAKYDNNLDLARFRVIESIANYFTDVNTDKIMQDVSNMSEKDFRYELFSYMFDCDQDELDELLMQLAATVPQVTLKYDTVSSPRSAEVITDVDIKYFNPDGTEVASDLRRDDEEELVERRVTPEDKAFLQTIEAEERARVAVDDTTDDSTIIYPAPVGEVEPYVYLPYDPNARVAVDDTTDDSTEVLEDWLAEAKELLIEQLDQFEAEGILSASSMTARKISTLSSSAIMGTQKMADRGIANGIIGKELAMGNDKEIEIWQWLLMAIQNRAETAFNTNRRTKQVIEIAKKLVDAKIEEIESRKSQDSVVS